MTRSCAKIDFKLFCCTFAIRFSPIALSPDSSHSCYGQKHWSVKDPDIFEGVKTKTGKGKVQSSDGIYGDLLAKNWCIYYMFSLVHENYCMNLSVFVTLIRAEQIKRF